MKSFKKISSRFQTDVGRLRTDEKGNIKLANNYNRPPRKLFKLSIGAMSRMRLIGDPTIMRSHAFNGYDHINRGYPIPCLRTIGRVCPICNALEPYRGIRFDDDKVVAKLHQTLNSREEYVFNMIHPKKVKEEDYEVEGFAASGSLYPKIVKISELWGEAKFGDPKAAAAWDPENGIDLAFKKDTATAITVAPADGEREEGETESYIYPVKKSYPAPEEWLSLKGWFAQGDGQLEAEKEILDLFYYQANDDEYQTIAGQVAQLFANMGSFEAFEEEKPAGNSKLALVSRTDEDDEFEERSKAAAKKYTKKIAVGDEDEDDDGKIPF